MKDTIAHLKELLTNIEPLPWKGGYGNVPFYVVIEKPRPSQSKHDEDRPTYWDWHDGRYAIAAVHAVPMLLEYIEVLENKLKENNIV